jgi:FAD/FMN-containing dehydrogenase
MSGVRSDEHPGEFRGVFRTDLLARALYAEGAGIARAVPTAVAVPRDTEDVALLARWARASGHALIPRGSGSGMAAGAVGAHVIVDLSRFTQVSAVDQDRRTVRAGAGALRDTINAAAGECGLRFPVDPSSGAFCTIGGMVATNAAGARSLRFGATRAWVIGVRCVFDDGSVAWIRRGERSPRRIPAVARMLDTIELLRGKLRPSVVQHGQVRKESSGYDIAGAMQAEGELLDLLVGSEGTLAIFTEVELQLTTLASATATVLVSFDSLERASRCATAVTEAGASACEMLDRTYIRFAEASGPTGISPLAEAVLLVELEGRSAGEVDELLERVDGLCRAGGAVDLVRAVGAENERRLWALRHSASPTLARLPRTMRSMQFIEDGCVPPDRFADYVRGVRAAMDAAGIPGVIFGHAGDAHAHVNPLIDVTQSSWRTSMHRLLGEVTELTSALGGTLAGEHGDGRLRAPLLDQVWPMEAVAAFANVKAAADPAGAFNPGCKIALRGEDPLRSIRYDPDLPPLPPAARSALDAVEADRAWHRYRLDYAG